MRKALILVALLGLSGVGYGQEISRLRDVHKVYVDSVDSFGDLHNATSFREELVRQLVESKQVVVVDDPTQADAILTRVVDGDYIMGEIGKMGGTPVNISGHSRKGADVFLMLTSRSKKIIIWQSGERLPQWAIAAHKSRAANKVIKKLQEDIKKNEKTD